MAHVYLIHGFNVRDGGKNTTGTLRNQIEEAGHTVEEIHYGFFHRWRVRWCNRGVARAVSSMARKDSYVIAHSNGAAIVYLAAKFGAPFKHVFLINPALNSKLEIPNVEKVDVFYSESDFWTGLAKFIPASLWGSQGRVGYKGEDEEGRYSQTELDKLAGREVGHSGIFETHTSRRRLLQVILTSIK